MTGCVEWMADNAGLAPLVGVERTWDVFKAHGVYEYARAVGVDLTPVVGQYVAGWERAQRRARKGAKWGGAPLRNDHSVASVPVYFRISGMLRRLHAPKLLVDWAHEKRASDTGKSPGKDFGRNTPAAAALRVLGWEHSGGGGTSARSIRHRALAELPPKTHATSPLTFSISETPISQNKFAIAGPISTLFMSARPVLHAVLLPQHPSAPPPPKKSVPHSRGVVLFAPAGPALGAIPTSFSRRRSRSTPYLILAALFCSLLQVPRSAQLIHEFREDSPYWRGFGHLLRKRGCFP